MILHCNFEELGALRRGANGLLAERPEDHSAVVAPPEGFEEVEALFPRLHGDLSVETLAEQRRVLMGLSAIVSRLKEEMDASVLTTHPADESSVSSYFHYAHAMVVLNRATELGQEMEALIEVVTGAPVTPAVAATFRFPD
ncbi:MAG: hypothetical protein HKO65_19645 [Gemmatimonadetes bacterium]|nr:hypothetical protein [Gemmatimonadota bacterium]